MITPPTVPISVVIPTVDRLDVLLNTLDRIECCVPAPAEILVHVDGGSPAMLDALRNRPGNIRILSSLERLGAGGSRNMLIQSAAHEWIANFDDDSYPMSPDYFARVQEALGENPDMALLSASSLPEHWEGQTLRPVAVYSGYACVFNRGWFLRTQGFVPLPFAYCMEEVDLGLRLHALGGLMLHDPRLRVIHNMTVRPPEKEFHSKALANIALFAFLRYPLWLMGIGIFQVLRRLFWLLKNCPAAIPGGLATIPGHLFHHTQWRNPVSARSLISWLRLQRAGFGKKQK